MYPNFKNKKATFLFRLVVMLVCVWAGMFLSLPAKRGYLLADWMKDMQNIYIPLLKENLYGIRNPIWWKDYVNEYTGKTVLMAIVAGILILLHEATSHRNYIAGKEFGNAEYKNPKEVNKELSNKNPPAEKIHREVITVRKWYHLFLKTKVVFEINTMNRRISENIYVSMDSKDTDRNNNMLVIGGSGSGKSFRLARNILRQMNGSYVVTDPKGELARKEGKYLEDRGYDVKVLNVLDLPGMRKSVRYNPFRYVRDSMDILRLCTNIMANTKPKDAGMGGDPFFDIAAGTLLEALCFYVCEVYKNNPKKKSFRTVMELLAMADFEIDPQTMTKKKSPLDILFDELEEKENRRIAEERRTGKVPRPMSEAVIKYNSIMRGAADTVRSIVITLDSRLSKLHLPEMLDLLSDDEISIPELGMGKNYDGKTKTALFLVIPDNDTSFNFVVGMFYTQLNQILSYQADVICEGALPISVTMLMDEFANVALPEDYDKKLSTMRSRNMSAIIIIQNLAQLKKLFEKDWESIVGNCDTFIYLGGNEQGSHEYVSKLIGKKTFDKRTFGETLGIHGSANRNYDVIGRDLLQPDEIRRLPRKKCIILISGMNPIIDDKIRTDMHPLFKYIKETYSYDRRKHVKGGMYFVNKSYADALKREEEHEEISKTLVIDGNALMNLPAEAIDAYAESSLYSDLTEDLIAVDIMRSEELKKELPLTDEELQNLPEKEMTIFLLLRSDGYTDRQIRALIKLIESGKPMEETTKMFPTSMEASRMEKLIEKLIA